MTQEELTTLMETPMEQVEEETREELAVAGYAEELETMSFGEVADIINQDIFHQDDHSYDETPKPRRKKRGQEE
jgi:DNA-binding protein H-NS